MTVLFWIFCTYLALSALCTIYVICLCTAGSQADKIAGRR